MRRTLYSLALLLAIPYMFWQRLRTGKYRGQWAARLGLRLPTVPPGKGPLLWVHAVSMGETLAVIPLIESLKAKHPDLRFVISSVTETGHAAAKERLPGAAAHFYLPLDFAWTMRRLARRLKPDLVVLAETDYWWNMLSAVKAQGARIAVVNGKISQRSMRRFARMPGFTQRLLAPVDLFLVQGEIFRDRLQTLAPMESRIRVTGNIKMDSDPEHLSDSEKAALRDQLGISEGVPVLVAGSTHDPEEALILDSAQKLWQTQPDLHVVIVPRHPERFDEVARLIEQRGLGFRRVSTGEGNGQLTLVDAMGMLRKCYQLASVAVVAGSFTPKVGGHNIMEPCAYSVPVLFGPYMYTQPVLVDLMESHHAGECVSASELTGRLSSLLSDEKERCALGERGRVLDASMRGATAASCDLLEALGALRK